MNNPLRDLGETVATASDRHANVAATLLAARGRLFQGRARPRPRSAKLPLRLAMAAVVGTGLAAAALVVLHRTPGATPLSYVVRDGATVEQRPFVETKERRSEIQFSEGSVVAVMPESGLRVLDLTRSGVTLSVERGQAHFKVVHRSDTSWTVRAGPFDVHVTGTRFTTEWHPADGRFEIGLEEGSVDVTGPQLTGAQRLVAGEHLVVGLRQGTKALTQGQAPREQASDPARPAMPAAAAEVASSAKLDRQPNAEPVPARDREQPRWDELARSGKYRDAMKVVDGLGFEAVLRQADAGHLRLLADAARLAGSGKQAQRALLALRRQHGVKAETAFLLGKVAADQLRAPGEALNWFDTYLREEPRGALREQAMGRSLELDANRPGAGPAERARKYLAAYPNGAYAPLAHRVLEKSAASQ